MKNNAYWQQRFIQLEKAQNEMGVDAMREIEMLYRKAQAELDGKIRKWYQRFADNNQITLAEARKWLDASQLAELKWDVNQYIKHGRENALTGGWMKEMENASAKYHISKFEALKVQTRQSMEQLFAKQFGIVNETMGNVYKSGYYHTAFELQKGFSVGWDIAGLDQPQIEKVISKPWGADGKNFSERLWGNKQKLINEVHSQLTQGVMLGHDPQKEIDAIAQKMNASKKNAGRLVMTEEPFFSSAAQKDCFERLGVEQYEIVAMLDSHTSEICRSLDGQHFPMKEYQPGLTAPPFHPWCRSTTAPYFEDDFGEASERVARDEATGKRYYIPDDMNYQKWHDTFVEDGDKSGFDVIDEDGVVHYARKNKVTKDSKGDTIKHMDITDKWIKNSSEKGSVTKKQEYIINGEAYKVDGKHVILRPTEQEMEIAELLSGKYGKVVELVPQVLFPQGIQTPDYMIDGDRFDLKSPTGKGKNVIYGLIAKKRKQADNFIIDITKCPLSIEELERQIESLYISPRLGFLGKIVLVKNMEVLRMYGRK